MVVYDRLLYFIRPINDDICGIRATIGSVQKRIQQINETIMATID
jgi:hypothetical protein